MSSTLKGASLIKSNLTIGEDADGSDLKVFSDTTGAYMLYDASANLLTHLGALTIGADGTGHDVIFYGDTADSSLTWDADTNNLKFAGVAGMQFGTLSSSSQTGIHLTATNNTVVDVFADDNNTTLTNAVYSTIRSRTMLFKDCTGITLIGVKGQIKCADEIDFASGVYAPVQGYFETMDDTDIQSGAKFWGIDSSIESPSGGTVTVDSGGILGGLHAELTGAGEFVQSSSGILAGLYIDEQVTTGKWGYGIYSPTDAVDVGIYLRPSSKGMDVDVTDVTTSGYGNAWMGRQASGKSDGVAGYFEGHASGTSTGATYGLGAWLNVDSGTHAYSLYGLDVGVYAADATYTGSYICAAAFYTHVCNDTAAPANHYMLRFNTNASEDTPDAWFHAANPQCIACTDNTDATGSKVSAIKINVTGSTADPGYIWVYDSTGA